MDPNPGMTHLLANVAEVVHRPVVVEQRRSRGEVHVAALAVCVRRALHVMFLQRER